MKSIPFLVFARLLMPLLLVVSIFLLLRGHNLPGGGFVGGLLAGLGFALIRLAAGRDALRETLRVAPYQVIGVGILTAFVGAVIPMFVGEPLLKSLWTEVGTPFGPLALGTPLIFDVGVYLLVIGVVSILLVTLGENWE